MQDKNMNFQRNKHARSDNCCPHFVSLCLCGYNKVQKEFASAPILSGNSANLPYSLQVWGEAMLLKQPVKKYLQDAPWQVCQATTMHNTARRALIIGRDRNAPTIDKYTKEDIVLDRNSNCFVKQVGTYFFKQAKSLVKNQFGFRKTRMLSRYKWIVSDLSA